MSSGLILTYLEMTAISSRCRSGRKLALPPPSRSWAMISCSRSLATAAVFGLLPKSMESSDMSLASEQALEQARLDVVDEAQGLLFAQETGDDILVGFGRIGLLLVNDRSALVGGLQHLFGFRNDA